MDMDRRVSDLKEPTINPPMARERGGWMLPQQDFPIFLENAGRAFFANQIFCCRLILGTSVQSMQKYFQIGPTVLALKSDKGRMATNTPSPLSEKVDLFF